MQVPFKYDWIYQLYIQEQAAQKSNTDSDYYVDDNNNLVMTETYHLKRGTCCGNKCKHCPYNHKNVKK